MYAEYDLLSGCKLGSTESPGGTAALCYSPDASQLYALTVVRLLTCMSSQTCDGQY